MNRFVFGNLQEKFALIENYWDPHVAADLNGQQIKLAKIKGEFDMHKHDSEDELFLIYKGELHMHLEEEVKTVKEGEFIMIPKGLNHKPVALEETWIILFEPATTLNTGDKETHLTKRELKRV